MTDQELFHEYLAPTSSDPIGLPIIKAKGAKLWDDRGKAYIDLMAGASVCNIGHCQPKVIKAIKKQSEKHLHIMVYGELVQKPQVKYAEQLIGHLPDNLGSIYFTNSGSEAIEGAMKLGKRLTGRTEIIAFENSYHGSTQGALSLMGAEYKRQSFRPLLPDIRHIRYNHNDDLKYITKTTAAIILEPIQAASGITIANKLWIKAVRKRCDETGCLLILDEIQTGFGRTGKLWAFEHFGIIPDFLVLGKALGGGMPMGALVASKENMAAFTHNPMLGHITTFGGHPVCCAAGNASFKIILENNLAAEAVRKGQLFKQLLKHPAIKAVHGMGLMLSITLKDFDSVYKLVKRCRENQPTGLLTNFFIFSENCIRLSPPLVISEAEIRTACEIILEQCDSL